MIDAEPQYKLKFIGKSSSLSLIVIKFLEIEAYIAIYK